LKKNSENLRRIGLVANPEKTNSRALVQKVARAITAHGSLVLTNPGTAEMANLRVETRADIAALGSEVDLLMVFGGDGTVLSVARALRGSATPIFGINVGGLGFLTSVQAPEVPKVLQQLWAGAYVVENRSLIETSAKSGKEMITQVALNDFVLSRGAASRLIELNVTVDGEILTRYRCDGLIISSPTGSTAYSLAAGGAVVSPAAEVFAITPICPHTLSNRSVIVGLQSKIEVTVLSRKLEVFLTADGQEQSPLAFGDIVQIYRSRKSVRLVRLLGRSFFETLRKKLNWSGSNV